MSARTEDLTALADTVEVGTTNDRQGSAAVIQILGTWSGTITFECKQKTAATWASIIAVKADTDARATTAVSTTTEANGVYRCVSDGLDIRARMSSYVSGTANLHVSTVTV
ncbi:MAG: hypothetical protein KAJ55_00350 [Anaerolineales bacterium]|nr:hypothetical protein [Anaerolineales bacterium]